MTKRFLMILVMVLLVGCAPVTLGNFGENLPRDLEAKNLIYIGQTKKDFCWSRISGWYPIICYKYNLLSLTPNIYFKKNTYEVLASEHGRYYVFKNVSRPFVNTGNTGDGILDSIHSSMAEAKKYIEKNTPEVVETPDPTPTEPKPVASSGSAFFIDNKGHLITNFHVVKECYDQSKIIYKTNEYDAKLIAKDEFLDLALLKADVQNNKFIMISSKPPKKLKRIIVAGYPFGKELSDDLKFNSGIITSLKGLGDDSTRIQIDAAVNLGNSGGPIVYEENGQLAAVAVAGLRKDLTEGVNFGIKGSSLRNFLESNQLDLASIAQKFSFSDDDLAELLEAATIYTFCN